MKSHIYLLLSLALVFFSELIAADPHEEHHIKSESDRHNEEKHHGDADHHHDSGKAIGHNKAIVKVDEELGFQLSLEAAQMLGVKTKALRSSKPRFPASSLVFVNDVKGIYRLRQGYFKFVPLTSVKIENSFAVAELEDVKDGDKIVTEGVDLLRITDVYSTDESEYGHSH